MFAVMQGRAPIQRLDVSAEFLHSSDIQQMRRALNKGNLLGHLLRPKLSQPTQGLSETEPALVTAATFCLDVEPSLSNTITLDQPHHDLPMAYRSGCWLRVLLPGWGPAWVHDDARTIQEQTVSPLNDAPRKPVTEIAISFLTDESMPSTLQFLELLGRDVRRLHISKLIGNAQMGQWFQRLLVSCAHLEDLAIKNVDLDSTQFIVDSYAREFCRIKRLAFYGVRVHGHAGGDDVEENTLLPILEALGDEHHAITKYLDHITLRASVPVSNDLLNKAATMLDKNDRLLSLNVSTSNLTLGLADWIRHVDSFTAKDNTVLTRRRSRFYLKKQLAFLSVTMSRSGAVLAMDTSVIARVFEFAAENACRRVSLTRI